MRLTNKYHIALTPYVKSLWFLWPPTMCERDRIEILARATVDYQKTSRTENTGKIGFLRKFVHHARIAVMESHEAQYSRVHS